MPTGAHGTATLDIRTLNTPYHRIFSAHMWSIDGPILPNHLNMLKTMFWSALLVATNSPVQMFVSFF